MSDHMATRISMSTLKRMMQEEYDRGAKDGFVDGYDEAGGYEAGVADGYGEGHDDGYAEGYEEGIATADQRPY